MFLQTTSTLAVKWRTLVNQNTSRFTILQVTQRPFQKALMSNPSLRNIPHIQTLMWLRLLVTLVDSYYSTNINGICIPRFSHPYCMQNTSTPAHAGIITSHMIRCGCICCALKTLRSVIRKHLGAFFGKYFRMDFRKRYIISSMTSIFFLFHTRTAHYVNFFKKRYVRICSQLDPKGNTSSKSTPKPIVPPNASVSALHIQPDTVTIHLHRLRIERRDTFLRKYVPAPGATPTPVSATSITTAWLLPLMRRSTVPEAFVYRSALVSRFCSNAMTCHPY